MHRWYLLPRVMKKQTLLCFSFSYWYMYLGNIQATTAQVYGSSYSCQVKDSFSLSSKLHRKRKKKSKKKKTNKIKIAFCLQLQTSKNMSAYSVSCLYSSHMKPRKSTSEIKTWVEAQEGTTKQQQRCLTAWDNAPVEMMNLSNTGLGYLHVAFPMLFMEN